MLKRVLVPVFAVAFIFSAGCSDQEVVQPNESDLSGVTLAKLPDGVQEVKGRDDDGAKYALYVPDEWNGDLIVYAHQYQTSGALPTFPERDALLGIGYAVAYSSFSKIGWAIEEGAYDTYRLSAIFEEYFPAPEKTYIMGFSMGGLIAIMLAEQYPDLYAGALSISGAIGGTPKVIDHMSTVRVLFDYYYPGVLPGAVDEQLKSTNASDAAAAAYYAMVDNMGPAYELASVDQADLKEFDIESELQIAIYTQILTHLSFYFDLLGIVDDEPFFGNADVEYTSGGILLEPLNAGVYRCSSSAEADQYFESYYQPTGELAIPVFGLTNTRDANAPISHIYDYEQLVTLSGCGDMFEYQTIDRNGHGATEEEILAALEYLVNWAAQLE